MKKITVSDVTLSTIAAQNLPLTFRERLAIAEKIDACGIDYIELPTLTNSKENGVIYGTIVSSVKNAAVKIPIGFDCDFFDFAVECGKKAKKLCLQVVLPVSTAQMEYKYHLKAPLMLEKIAELVKKTKEVCDSVEFVALDAFRAENGFLESCVKTAVDNGACAVTVSDDAGIAFPEDYAKVVKNIKAVTTAELFVQPSDALKMSVACAVEAIKAGADGVKTSVFGDYLSATVFADVIRAKKFDMDVTCSLDVTKIKSISTSINDVVDGVSEQQIKIPNGFIESSANFKDVAEVVSQLGYELSEQDVGNVFEEFKKVAQKKETVEVKELEAIIASTAMQVPSTYHLINYVVTSGNIISATANVTLEKDGEKFTGVSTGDGPIDAAFHAIEQIIGHHYELDDFQVHAVTKGRGAVGSSIIRLRADGKLYPGNGVSTDIIGACIRAYINAINKIVYGEN